MLDCNLNFIFVLHVFQCSDMDFWTCSIWRINLYYTNLLIKLFNIIEGHNRKKTVWHFVVHKFMNNIIFIDLLNRSKKVYKNTCLKWRSFMSLSKIFNLERPFRLSQPDSSWRHQRPNTPLAAIKMPYYRYH